jgi:hypothetical protein
LHISPFDYPGDQIVTPRPGQALLAKRAVISAKYYRVLENPEPDPKTAKKTIGLYRAGTISASEGGSFVLRVGGVTSPVTPLCSYRCALASPHN